MPFKLIKKGVGYFVENILTKKRYSNKPITKEKANRQKSLLEKIEKIENKKIKKLTF
tara:strand:- start:272 stop:442 length:171 start_codon:yes stop_codon:yes gene_type:complete